MYGFQDDILIDGGGHTKLPSGSWSGGGSLFVRHRLVTAGFANIDWKYFGDYSRTPYVGNITATPILPLTDSEVKSSRTTEGNATWAYGATGWKRARPGNPVAGVATFIGELREGLPRIPLALHKRVRDLIQGKAAWRRINGRTVGDDYLNVMFGWIPLLSDLRKMHKLSMDIDKRLARIVRDNGKGVHKRREIKNSSNSVVDKSEWDTPFYGWNNAPGNIVNGYGRVVTVTTNTEKVWFAGRFRYYIPDIGSNPWRRRTVRALYGANVTPEVVWNLLPWSWLADWFGNIGDVMSNASSNAVDNLTADYAYVMRTLEIKTEYFGSASWGSFDSGDNFTKVIKAGSAQAYAVTKTEYKLRSVGSPFGFGATFDGLSNYQMGIAAALGISRANF
jgi:hypothetical protein